MAKPKVVQTKKVSGKSLEMLAERLANRKKKNKCMVLYGNSQKKQKTLFLTAHESPFGIEDKDAEATGTLG